MEPGKFKIKATIQQIRTTIHMFGDNNTNQFVVSLLQHSVRLDGRECFQDRDVQISFMDQHGSLLYSQGKTQVLVKIAAEITAPRPERPAEGFVHFKVNCMACPHNFDHNKKSANELTKLLEKIIIGSNALDPESLCILTGKFVWQLTVDCIVVRDDGNIVDAALNGVMVALMDMRKPLVDVQKNAVKLGNKQLNLSIAHTPFSFTFGMVENTIFIDPTYAEEENAQTRITISMNVYKELCSIHKPGGKGITEAILSGAVRVCQSRIKDFTQTVRRAVKTRKSIRDTF